MKEIFTKTDKTTTLSISNSEIHSLRNKSISSTGLRIYQDDCIGVAGAQGKADLNELQTAAETMLKMSIPYPYQPAAAQQQSVQKELELPAGFSLTTEVTEILSALKAAFPDMIISHQASLHETESRLSNELGLDLHYRDAYLGFGFVFKEKSSANIMDGFFGYGGRQYDRNQFIRSYLEILTAYKNPVSLPDKKDLPVIFSTDSNILQKLNSDLNGLQLGTGSSLLTSHIGQDKFHKDLTLWQTHNPDDGIMQFFDMEGQVNPGFRVPLIQNGKIIQGYTDKKIAAKYGLPYTGCASGVYDSIPKLGGADLKMQPSQHTLSELLGGELGIYVYVSSGGDFTHTGDYAAPVQLAFLTDGTNLLGKLPELNIGGNLFEMFGADYIGVSQDKVYVHDFAHYLVMNMRISKLY
jgi:PmbA protein